MARFVIDGGVALNGSIRVESNKNAVLPMMAACLLTDDDCIIDNVPGIVDVATMSQLLRELGATVESMGEQRLRINCATVSSFHPAANLVERLRASIVLMGPLLARLGQANMHHPGGDAIGSRSIATHLRAFDAMGAEFAVRDNFYSGRFKRRTEDCRIFLDEASVTATENVMLLAATQPCETVVRNAASEPHIMNLAGMLRDMGAQIEGAGSNVLRIRGCDTPRGVTAVVWPDHVEVGTFAALAAACQGDVVIHNVIPDHLEMVFHVLSEMRVRYHIDGNSMRVLPSELRAVPKIQTGVWPALPTDLSSIFIILATQAVGMTLVHDWMYESRMFFVDKLVQMGANIVLADPHRAVISGPTPLRGSQFVSPDIRAGIALVMAALIASGRSEIEHIELIDRGYERIDERLRALGAQIERVS